MPPAAEGSLLAAAVVEFALDYRFLCAATKSYRAPHCAEVDGMRAVIEVMAAACYTRKSDWATTMQGLLEGGAYESQRALTECACVCARNA